MALMAALWLLQGGLKADGKAGSQVEDRAGGQADTLRVMFWNLENFFDWRNDSTSVSDAEFSSLGKRHWTRKRFGAKCQATAKSLLWIAGETGRLPEIIGLAEIENAFVLRRLLQDTPFRKLDYRYVHFDSPDSRGIDVALLYRTSRLELVEAAPCHLYDSLPVPTRDILLCRFRMHSGADKDPDFAVLVNHHPSKYGGAALSAPRRSVAVRRLRSLVDSLIEVGCDRILAIGDFNTTPDDPVLKVLSPPLIPLHACLFRRGEGTIKYDGRWELIDHAYVSGKVRQSAPCLLMRIIRIPFLLTRDTVHSGEKPLRTYLGPRYTGGVSDHLPILVEWVVP